MAKIRVHRAALAIRELTVIAQFDPGSLQRSLDFAPRIIGIVHECLDLGADTLDLLGEAPVENIGGGFLLQHSHPDHEELVEIREKDGKELHPLQQRIGGILRFLKDAPLKCEKAEFAIEVKICITQRRRNINDLDLMAVAGHSHHHCTLVRPGEYYKCITRG